MAIVKATFTTNAQAAKASVRYIEHRPGKDNAKITRTLWGIDGKMERKEAYRMIDEAKQGSVFYRFVLSPDPQNEDTNKDIYLRDLIEHTMFGLENRLQREIQWVAATHADHAPHRHVHIVALLPKKLQVHDLKAIRQMATEAALDQRKEKDRVHALQRTQEQEQNEQWELQH